MRTYLCITECTISCLECINLFIYSQRPLNIENVYNKDQVGLYDVSTNMYTAYIRTSFVIKL